MQCLGAPQLHSNLVDTRDESIHLANAIAAARKNVFEADDPILETSELFARSLLKIGFQWGSPMDFMGFHGSCPL